MSTPHPLITVDPEFMSGVPIFTGTRVPIQNLFDYIEDSETLEEFLDDFPNVSREHAIAVLELAKRTVGAEAAKIPRCPSQSDKPQVAVVRTPGSHVPSRSPCI